MYICNGYKLSLPRQSNDPELVATIGTFRCNTAFRLSDDARGLYEIADLEEDPDIRFRAGWGGRKPFKDFTGKQAVG